MNWWKDGKSGGAPGVIGLQFAHNSSFYFLLSTDNESNTLMLHSLSLQKKNHWVRLIELTKKDLIKMGWNS